MFFFWEMSFIGFLAIIFVVRDTPKLKNVFRLVSICVLHTLPFIIMIYFIRLEILEVNVQDLPQRLKFLLWCPTIRKLMVQQGDIAGTLFFIATQCAQHSKAFMELYVPHPLFIICWCLLTIKERLFIVWEMCMQWPLIKNFSSKLENIANRVTT